MRKHTRSKVMKFDQDYTCASSLFIPIEELLSAIATSLMITPVLGYFNIPPTSCDKKKYHAELEVWKGNAADRMRKESVNRPQPILKGEIAEQIESVHPHFSFNPPDARFIGSPLEYSTFDGRPAFTVVMVVVTRETSCKRDQRGGGGFMQMRQSPYNPPS